MSALVLILTAAMAVPGSGPEKVSKEGKQEPDLSGVWKGTYRSGRGLTSSIELREKVIQVTYKGRRLPNFDIDLTKATFEGHGKVRVTWYGINCLAIYRQDGDSLILSVTTADQGWPKSLKPTPDHDLFILHRVKPRK